MSGKRDQAQDKLPRWSEGICGDGAAILRDGVPVPIEEVISTLNFLTAARRKMPGLEAMLEQREEVLTAFVAKYGVQPELITQVEKRHGDGTISWHVVVNNPAKQSDGYHTFDELYEHRHALCLALMRAMPGYWWLSRRHDDGELCFGEGDWFVVGTTLPFTGERITYHLPNRLWEAAQATGASEWERAPYWDGHTPADVVDRLKAYATKPMLEISQLELKMREVLYLHSVWGHGGAGGRQLDLSYYDLRGVILRNTDMRCADLTNAKLEGAVGLPEQQGNSSVSLASSAPEQDGITQLQKEVSDLRRELERERLRLAVVGVVVMADTPESAARVRDVPQEFHSASMDDAIRMVDELVETRAKLQALEQAQQQATPRFNLRLQGFTLIPPADCPDPVMWIAERAYQMGKDQPNCPHIRSSDGGSSYCTLAEGNSSASLTISAPEPADNQTLHGIALRMVDSLDRLGVLPEIQDTIRQAIREPMAPPAPSTPAGQGGLVRSVANAIHPDQIGWEPEARSMIRVVADWLERQGEHIIAVLLRMEVER